MKNILEICKQLGVDVPEDKQTELTKSVSENYITKAEHEKKITRVEVERDSWKEKAESAENTLKGFEGVDVESIKKDVQTWKEKAEQSEKDYAAKIYKRDFDDALKAALSAEKFSSNAAMKSVMEEIGAADLKMVDGKILGLNDLMTQIKERDPSAFSPADDDDPKARFTQKMNGGGDKPKMTKEEILKIKDATERQQKIRENLELFGFSKN